jgi:hypothetical protein
MNWSVEAEQEVTEWATDLRTEHFARLAFYVGLLEREGALLAEPYTRQLSGKLRELRFHLDVSEWRIRLLHRLRTPHRATDVLSQDSAARNPRDCQGTENDGTLHD